MTEQERVVLSEVMIAWVLGAVTVFGSFGVGMIFSVGADPIIGRAAGAAWAWAIGGATGLWVIPWAKQAIPSVDGGESA